MFGVLMDKVILGVTISLDGFAEDSSGSVGPLYPDLLSWKKPIGKRPFDWEPVTFASNR
jgi:hypothetical protein